MRGNGDREGRPLLLYPVSMGLFVAILTVLVAALVASILLFIGWNWAPHIHTVSMSIAYTAVVLGSVFAGSRAGSAGWLVGLLTGACFVLLCFLLSLWTGTREMIPALSTLRVLAACGAGMVGGILGVNFSE